MKNYNQDHTPDRMQNCKTDPLCTLRSTLGRWSRSCFNAAPWRKNFFLAMLALICILLMLALIGIVQFHKSGLAVLLLVVALVVIEYLARRQYRKTFLLLRRLDELVKVAEDSCPKTPGAPGIQASAEKGYDRRGRTAVLLVNGFNGVGLHTLFSIIRLFGNSFSNFMFVQIGVLSAKELQDPGAVARKKDDVRRELDRYVNYMQCHGYFATGLAACGKNVVDEIVRVTPEVLDKFPNAVFFGGQLVFPKAPLLSGFFHNYTIFSVQRKFYTQGIPLVILPIRVL